VKSILLFVVAAVSVIFSLLPSLAAAELRTDRIIPLQRIDSVATSKTGGEKSPRPFPCIIGDGALHSPLRNAGRSYADLLKGPADAGADTIRVAIFRIEWENDSVEDVTTAPGGRMIVEADDSWPYAIDLPPHDSTYFHTHMQVLRTFIAQQSYGKLHVEWEIFPRSEKGAYRLHDTADYMPEGSPSSWDLIERSDLLVEFCSDAIRLVDTVDAEVDFSEYDGYLLFHAGPDLQTDIAGNSPGDIPSFFLTLGDSDLVFVDLDEDSFAVSTVTCLPEYDSQDGFTFGLNGVLAHEFGHQIGLPDLYNTATFWPAVGQWDLMDSGGLVSIGSGDGFLSGIIPTSFSVWSKLYLGWIDPVIMTGPGALSVACATHPDPPPGSDRYAMIPLNDTEYFLIENRHGLAPVDQFAARVDSLNSVVLGPVTNDELREPTYDYDFALPGWGLLIWHVNDRQINPYRVAMNDVNTSYLDRGLELEEADGIKDLGNPYSAYWDGSPYDPFFEGSADRFGPGSSPNSDLTDGARSFVEVSSISGADSVMSLQVDLRGVVSGFPLAMTADSTIIAPAGVVHRDGEMHSFWISFDSEENLIGGLTSLRFGEGSSGPEIARYLLPDLPAVFAVSGDMLAGNDGEEVITLLADGSMLRAGGDLFSSPSLIGSIGTDTIRTGPLVIDGDGDSVEELYIAAGNRLTGWSLQGDSISATLQVDLPGNLVSNLAAVDEGIGGPEIRLLTDDGRFHSVKLAAAVPEFETIALFPPTGNASVLSGNIDRSGDSEWLIVDGEMGVIRVLDSEGGMVEGWPVDLGRSITGEPFFTDRNGDGYPEFALPAGHALHLLERNGVSAEDTPYEIPELLRGSAASLIGNGLTLRLAGEDRFVPVAGDDGGRLWAWQRRDEVSGDWPVSTGIWNSLIVAAPLPGDSAQGIYALSRDGFLYAFLPGIFENGAVLWGGPGGDCRGQFNLDEAVLMEPDDESTAAAEFSGAYAYPNPSGGTETQIRFDLNRVANVEMKAYDMAGQVVSQAAVRGTLGANEINWATGDLPSGVYYVRLETGGEVEFIKVALVR